MSNNDILDNLKSALKEIDAGDSETLNFSVVFDVSQVDRIKSNIKEAILKLQKSKD
tara:strand:+ start:483 stop:650 length:168 start_codon:yes stop_codon:yes gene_type:complete